MSHSAASTQHSKFDDNVNDYLTNKTSIASIDDDFFAAWILDAEDPDPDDDDKLN